MGSLSIIILTWNHLHDTRRCLESLQGMMSQPDVEVIVVDNGSTDGTPDVIAAEWPDVVLLRNNRNRGVAVARNQGIARATGQVLLLLDNDTIVNDEAINGMRTYLHTHPRVGLCACCMTDGQGNVQPSFRAFPSVKSKLLSLLGLNTAAPHYHFDNEGAIEPFYVIGACQMIRREALAQVGPLDEAIFYGPEDADFCLRLRQAGWQVKYLPQYSIVHTYYRTTRRSPLSRLGLAHLKGLMHLYAKYHRIS